MIGGNRGETGAGIGYRAVVKGHGIKKIIGKIGGNGATSNRGSDSSGGARCIDRICRINISEFRLIEMVGAVGISSERNSDGDGCAASGDVLRVEGLRALQRTGPVCRSKGGSVNVSHTVGDGGNGQSLVAPLDGNDN